MAMSIMPGATIAAIATGITTGTMVGTTIILGTTILEIEIVGTITMDFFQDL